MHIKAISRSNAGDCLFYSIAGCIPTILPKHKVYAMIFLILKGGITMKKFILFFLMIAMLLCSFAAAEPVAAEAAAPAVNPYVISLTVGRHTYSLPMAVSELDGMGVSILGLDQLTESSFASSYEAHDGRNAFSLHVEYCALTPDDPWAIGCSLNAEKHAGISVNGMVLGQTTRSEVIETLGADKDGNTEGETLSYYFGGITNYELTFDAAAVLQEIFAWTPTVSDYGPVKYSAPAAQDLPDPYAMPYDGIIIEGAFYRAGDTVQKLLDNGWHLPLGLTADTKVKDIERNLVPNGGMASMFNGKSRMHVIFSDNGKASTPVRDCTISSLDAGAYSNVDFIAADDIRPGAATLADAMAAYGEITATEEDINFVSHNFSLLNGAIKYTIDVDAGENVVGMKIYGMDN